MNLAGGQGNSAKIVERCLDPAASQMLIFAEGTTTNGHHLLPFKRSAFLSKVSVHLPHRPVCTLRLAKTDPCDTEVCLLGMVQCRCPFSRCC